MGGSLHARKKLFLSTLSVRRATLAIVHTTSHFSISIHALREESDFVTCTVLGVYAISIHALREESDSVIATTHSRHRNFYPRSP